MATLAITTNTSNNRGGISSNDKNATTVTNAELRNKIIILATMAGTKDRNEIEENTVTASTTATQSQPTQLITINDKPTEQLKTCYSLALG